MFDQWHDPDRNDDESWRGDAGWSPQPSLGDPDAWRGDVHRADEALWRGEPTDEAWRGADHEWPEWTAGPEYFMWKRLVDDG